MNEPMTAEEARMRGLHDGAMLKARGGGIRDSFPSDVRIRAVRRFHINCSGHMFELCPLIDAYYAGFNEAWPDPMSVAYDELHRSRQWAVGV